MIQVITSNKEFLEIVEGLADAVSDDGSVEQMTDFNNLMNKLWSELLFSKSFKDFYGEVFKVDGNSVWVEEK